jgi:hypothetical protein
VWINGHAIGRYWNIGPQQTLYVPGPWLKAGDNQIIVFEAKGKGALSLAALDHPLLGGPVRPEWSEAALLRSPDSRCGPCPHLFNRCFRRSSASSRPVFVTSFVQPRLVVAF